MSRAKGSRPAGKAGIVLAAALLAATGAEAQGIPIRINGIGWIQAGRIMHSSDTIGFNYNGNWFQGVRGQMTALAEINPSWEGSIGIGIRQIQKSLTGQNVAQGSPSAAARLTVGVEPYIAQARFTYTQGGDKEATPFQLTFGYFPYKYNESVRNLGLYLLRGSVYPGFVFSGFEADETIGIASQLGTNLRVNTGPFSHDLLLTSETRIRPLFDYSLAYIGKFKPGRFFELGAGVNFYRLIPINGDLTTPRDPEVFQEQPLDSIKSPLDRRHFYVDSTGPGQVDTVRFSLAGTKAALFGSVDFKAITGEGALGPEDLKFYFEAAVIGVKNYKGIYDKIGERIPIMVGFNFPAFNILDHLSLEMEWYGSPYRNDYQKLENFYSPIPVSNQGVGRKPATDSTGKPVLSYSGENFPLEDPYSVENRHKDDIKWSLHGAKTIKSHIRISGQVANDHFRTGGTFFSDGYETAFSTLKDWYFMTKVSYFF